ncbi:MAG: type II secretion system minor pseudopilin GspK [Deltaproteobacteria bacterium]|nr:type II secretion system minor pseudopilin GspK [Deltaproteobacteria bacterium]
MKKAFNGKKKAGFALIITVLITAALAALISEVVYAVHAGASRAGAFRDSNRASTLAHGAVMLAAKTIKQGADDNRRLEPRIFVYGDALVSVRVEDEAGKINANSIVMPNGSVHQENFSAYKRLLSQLKLESSLAANLGDWIDANDDPMSDGAETRDYYARLAPPYAAKGAPLDSVEEAMLVKGYAPQAFAGLKPFITVYTDGLVNINTAPAEVISSLDPGITLDMAKRVKSRAESTRFTDASEIRSVAGFETIGFNLQGRIRVDSSIYRLFITVKAGEVSREVEAVIDVNDMRVFYWRQV